MLSRGALSEAGRRVHRRADGAAGPPNGSRRGNYRRRPGNGRGQGEGPGSRGSPCREVAGGDGDEDEGGLGPMSGRGVSERERLGTLLVDSRQSTVDSSFKRVF